MLLAVAALSMLLLALAWRDRHGRSHDPAKPPPRLDYGLWAMLCAGIATVLLGARLAFVSTWRIGEGWEFGHFIKELGVFLMFAGMLAWLVAAGLLVVRLGRQGRL